jgi:zinc resistance-associated protein
MRHRVIGLSVAGLLAAAAAAGAALAQDRAGAGVGFPGAHGPRGMGALSPADRAAFTDARIAALHAGLKLTPDQEKLWPPVEAAIRGVDRQRQEARAARRERFASSRESGRVDIPDQLRFMADRQAASAAALGTLADATGPLYAALDEAQKRRMAMLARPFLRAGRPEGRGGPGRWQRGDLGGPHFAARDGSVAR